MFTYDTRTENFLSTLGVKFTYSESIGFHELHENWRIENIGREEPVNDKAVEEYAEMRERGSPAPAVIVSKSPNGYEVMDGVQRLMAAELCDATTFAAYVVPGDIKDSTKHKLRICSSARINGQHTPSRSFTLANAVEYLFFLDKCSAQEIADALGRTRADVEEEIRFQKTARLASSTGYTGKLTDRRKRWFLAETGKHCDHTDWVLAPGPLKEMLEVFEDCNFTNGEANKLIESFFQVNRKAGIDRTLQFNARLSELKCDPEILQRTSKHHKTNHLDHVLSRLKAVDTILESAIDDGEHIRTAEFAFAIAEVVADIKSKLKRLTPKDIEFSSGRKNSSIYG